MPITDLTATNIAKVTRYREDGEEQLEALVDYFMEKDWRQPDEKRPEPEKKKVYPDEKWGFTPKNMFRKYLDKDERQKKADKDRRAAEERRAKLKDVPEDLEDSADELRKQGLLRWRGGMWRR